MLESNSSVPVSLIGNVKFSVEQAIWSCRVPRSGICPNVERHDGGWCSGVGSPGEATPMSTGGRSSDTNQGSWVRRSWEFFEQPRDPFGKGTFC
jgi:hypothetical protein